LILASNDIKNQGKTIADILEKFPASEIQEYLKRYFYQIIGIYFPALILVFYIFIFWYVGPNQDPITYYSIFPTDGTKVTKDNFTKGWPYFSSFPANEAKNVPNDNFTEGWPKIIPKNIYKISHYEPKYLHLAILLVIVVILGESINAVTSRYTHLSPVITNWKERIRYGRNKRSFPGMSKISNWPVWLNETSFPVSFAEFDRYYISALEQDKRTLAGKIGWLSFYRNMLAVFIVILILQIILVVASNISYCNCNWPLLPFLPNLHGYEVYVIVISIIAAIFFRYGLRAQEKSSKEILWDAYKRYQLRKNLEIRHGDITIAFRIKDDAKKIVLEYIIDRWFLGVENAKQTISRYLITKVEEEYKKLQDDQKQKEKNKFKKINNLLTDSYKHWNNGAYEHVIFTTINAFKAMDKLKSDFKKSAKSNTHDYKTEKTGLAEKNWKIILGFYILENSLRTDAAFAEINKTISNSNWRDEAEKNSQGTNETTSNDSTDKTKDAKRISNEQQKLDNYYNADYRKDKKYFDKQANLIRETTDLYQKAFFQIMFSIEKYNEVQIPEDMREEGFGKLEEIYELFGGFEYNKAFEKAKELLKWLECISKPKIESIFPDSGMVGGYISVFGSNFGEKRDIVWFDNLPIGNSEIPDNESKDCLIWYNSGNRIDICLPRDIEPKEYMIRVTKENIHSDPFPYKIEANPKSGEETQSQSDKKDNK
jgi:hypothetical protein